MIVRTGVLAVLLLPAASLGAAAQEPAAQQPAAPKILYETSPRAIEYQINRLPNAQLVLVDRKPGDPKYRPVYVALLTRKGLGREYFDEALAALAKIDGTSPARVLLDALPRIKPDDPEAAERMIRVLFAQPAEALKKERDALARAVEGDSPPFVLRAAYGAMMIADGDPKPAWQMAVKRNGHLVELLRAVPLLDPKAAVRDRLFEPVAGTLEETQDTGVRAAALAALGATRRDAATFRLLAQEVMNATDPELRAAAIRSLHRLPREAWPAGDVEPLARAVVAAVEKTPAERRTDLPAVDAIQLGEKLAEALPAESRRAILRDLRALGVQVVRIETIPEQMAFDVKWFAVQAGKPVQIVLYNPDAMAHNLLIVQPGALKEVGTAASAMTPPTDPKAKAYVPDSPLVLQATRLLNWAESERLSFLAPRKPGDYPFVCTFPGHWVRMYGVMLVVEDLEAWEATRTPPRDPMTGQPYR